MVERKRERERERGGGEEDGGGRLAGERLPWGDLSTAPGSAPRSGSASPPGTAQRPHTGVQGWVGRLLTGLGSSHLG